MWKVTVYIPAPLTTQWAGHCWPPMVATFPTKRLAAEFAKDIVEVGPASMAIGPEEV